MKFALFSVFGCVLFGVSACIPLLEGSGNPAVISSQQASVQGGVNIQSTTQIKSNSGSRYQVYYDDNGDRVVLDAQGRPVRDYCAQLRLESGYRLLERGKKFLESYYKTRNQSELFYAWYSSEDSLFMANSVGKCKTKRNKHFYAARNLIHKNTIIQNQIITNVRTTEYAHMSEVYLEDYRNIFPLDIQ